MFAGLGNHSETSAKFNPLALSYPQTQPSSTRTRHPTSFNPQGPRFPTSPLQDFSSDPPPWSTCHGPWVGMACTGHPHIEKRCWNGICWIQRNLGRLPHPKSSVWHRKRENSSIQLKTGISLESIHCWLLQLDLVWFPPQPRQPGRCLLHSPRGPCQDDCARCWALRVICYLHGSSSKILQRNRTYWSLLNPSASFTPLLTCSSSPTWHFPPSPSPPLGGMSLRLASPPWPRTRDVVPLPRKLPSLAPHPWCCWWWYESQLVLVSELKIALCPC